MGEAGHRGGLEGAEGVEAVNECEGILSVNGVEIGPARVSYEDREDEARAADWTRTVANAACTLVAAYDLDRREAALRTFKRAMRRHERRARRVGLASVAEVLRGHALDIAAGKPLDCDFARWAQEDRRDAKRWGDGQRDREAAYLYERAADAVAKFTATLRGGK